MLSYAGQLNCTVIADRDSTPDLPVFVHGLQRSPTELGGPVDQFGAAAVGPLLPGHTTVTPDH